MYRGSGYEKTSAFAKGAPVKETSKKRPTVSKRCVNGLEVKLKEV